jgi:hypothetical protein
MYVSYGVAGGVVFNGGEAFGFMRFYIDEKQHSVVLVSAPQQL